jgi:hypothetical protein
MSKVELKLGILGKVMMSTSLKIFTVCEYSSGKCEVQICLPPYKCTSFRTQSDICRWMLRQIVGTSALLGHVGCEDVLLCISIHNIGSELERPNTDSVQPPCRVVSHSVNRYSTVRRSCRFFDSLWIHSSELVEETVLLPPWEL